MTDRQKSNLATVAKALLTEHFETEFDMRDFAYSKTEKRVKVQPHGIENECGTSACFAGHGPLVLGPTEHKCWDDYVRDMFGISGFHNTYWDAFDFLFDPVWPSSRQQAAARAYRFLCDAVVPDDCEYGTTLYEVPSPDKFDRFIIPPTTA